MRAVSLGLGARKLRDTDLFSKSDPFCVISRPNLQGGFTQIRMSETKQNTLNPDWNDFFFKEEEVPGHDMTLNLKIEVYDDDGKKGLDNKDKLLGTGHFSLKQLEAASLLKTALDLFDGKSKKRAGTLIVRSFKIHENNLGMATGSQQQQPQPSGNSGYPSYPAQPGGYPPQKAGGYPGSAPTGYPPNQSGYPPNPTGYPPNPSGYPPNPTGYPSNPTGYPPNPTGYPSNPTGYPPNPTGYPSNPSGVPPNPSGYPNPNPAGYPPNPSGYPPNPSGYPPNPSGYPQSGFNMPGALFPDSNLPSGPGYQ